MNHSISQLPKVVALALLVSACDKVQTHRVQVGGALPEQGRANLEKFDCGVCHVIPGVRNARGQVGPTLAAYSSRVYVAGKFPNTPSILARWIQDAPSMAPDTAMPAIAMTEEQARDIAAYLFTLE